MQKLRYGDVKYGFYGSASELSGFYVFLQNDSTNMRQIFLGFRKHLFITTCCEYRCTGPLSNRYH